MTTTRAARRISRCSACAIARHTAPDDAAGLPEPDTLAREIPDLDLHHLWALDATQATAGVKANANRALAPYGRKIGPDPASIDAAKIGGIAANNASGMCCGTRENSYHTLAGVRVMLADGAVTLAQAIRSARLSVRGRGGRVFDNNRFPGSGAPTTVYDYSDTDHNDDVGTRSRFAAWVHEPGEDAFKLPPLGGGEQLRNQFLIHGLKLAPAGD